MNYVQKQIYEVICGICRVENIVEYYPESVIRYGILNYIAKYSLANDRYFVTKKSLEHLNRLNLLSDKKLRRGVKSTKLQFTYEHPIPAKVIGEELIKHHKDPEAIKRLLCWTDVVTVLTKDENDILNQKFRSEMPPRWKFFEDSQFARYEQSGIATFQDLSTVEVYGKVSR
jgi:hypothetical protein